MALLNTNCSTCSQSIDTGNDGIELECKHLVCLRCLQDTYNNDKNDIKCKLCRKVVPGIFREHSTIDATNVVNHILIGDFSVKLTTNNHSGNKEYGVDLVVTGKLTSPTREQRDAFVKNHHDGTYDLTGSCDVEGEWQLMCYIDGKEIKQSPLPIKVVKCGLQEVPDLFRAKKNTMFEIFDDIVYACGERNEIDKFSLSGVHMSTIYGPTGSKFVSLCCGNYQGKFIIACYDSRYRLHIYRNETWMKCTDIGNPGQVFGKIILHDGKIYIPDYYNNRVLCVSVDGKLMRPNIIDSSDYLNVKIHNPYGVAITQEGNVLVLSYGKQQLSMFDSRGQAKVLIRSGEQDGKLYYPYSIDTDERGQIIIGSWKKIQVFDKDGSFIKRIDEAKNLPVKPYSICCKNRCIWASDYSNDTLRLYYY